MYQVNDRMNLVGGLVVAVVSSNGDSDSQEELRSGWRTRHRDETDGLHPILPR